jgi:2,4-didehydro-3-deoxy-L-rhamnonate hydrolase
VRIGNLAGRLTLFSGEPATAVDVEKASAGRFGPDPQAVYDVWPEFVEWAEGAALEGGVAFDPADLGAPTPAPAQVFAIGLNYSEHAAESKLEAPTGLPPVFTKFRTSLSGPVTTVVLPEGGNVDWEIELVVVIGRRAERVAAADAWSHVAGLTAGQDISERVTQLAGPAPQFGLGKSFPGFAPLGPWVVTPDELPDRDDIALSCAVDGETVQDGRTRDLIYPVAKLVEGLSRVAPLLPGDIIFTGTPAGVGMGRNPQRWLQPGEVLTSAIEGIGELRQTFVAG